MPKKIIYFVQRYRPSYEAISKEVYLLQEYFSKKYFVTIHDLHLDGILSFRFSKKLLSYHFVWYPFLFVLTYLLNKSSDINHIYTSLGDLPYLRFFDPKKTVLTAAASCDFEKVKRRRKYLRRLAKIVVVSERQGRDLISLGVAESKIVIQYPPVDISKFNYIKPTLPFKILYASCPTRIGDFEKRGITLILQYAKYNNSVSFYLPWRGDKYSYSKICDLIKELKLNNVFVTTGIMADMNTLYGKVHCTIIPYTKYDNFLKLYPNSAIESLSAGKPILVSEFVGLSSLVYETSCGQVFSPNLSSLHITIKKLRKNYSNYQTKCRRVAEEYFSSDNFVHTYEHIYNAICSKSIV